MVMERKEKAKQGIRWHHLYYIISMPSLGSRLGDLSLVGAVLSEAISLALPKETVLDSWLSSLWICMSAKHMRSHTSSLKGPKVYWNATQNTGAYIMPSISEHRPNKQAEVGQGMVSSHPLLLAAPSSPLCTWYRVTAAGFPLENFILNWKKKAQHIFPLWKLICSFFFPQVDIFLKI